MTVEILVVGDTHVMYFKNLPKEMLNYIQDAKWVIHVGDYVSKDVLQGFIKLKGKRFIGVYGNADPLMVRKEITAKRIIEVEGRKIAIIHPASGGPIDIAEKRVLAEFRNDSIDIIIYGHTHEPKFEIKSDVILVNPGKGYIEKSSYGPTTTLAILRIDHEISGEIIQIKE